GVLVHALEPDARMILLIQQVQVQVALLCGAVKLHRDVHQAEADRSAPDGSHAFRGHMIRTSDERGIATVIHRIWSDAFRRSGTVDYDPGRSVHIRFAPVILPALG